MEQLRLEQIRLDGGTQPRAFINDTAVAEYAESLTDGATLPPVVVFYDGSDHWLADGFHRTKAAVKCGFLTIDADIRQGTKRDAVLFSVGANASHGLRRTNQDKRRAVETLLRDEEWVQWSDTKIADSCGVGRSLVTDMRESIMPKTHDSTSRKVERNGTTYTQKVKRPRYPTVIIPRNTTVEPLPSFENPEPRHEETDEPDDMPTIEYSNDDDDDDEPDSDEPDDEGFDFQELIVELVDFIESSGLTLPDDLAAKISEVQTW